MQGDKLTALTISGPIGQLDDAVRRFVVDRPFHPEEAAPFLAGVRSLRRVEAEDPYTPLLARADALLASFGQTAAYAEHPAYELSDTEAYLDRLQSELDSLRETPAALERPGLTAEDPIVQLLRNVPESLKALAELKYAHVRLGTVPEDRWEALAAFAAERRDVFAAELQRAHGEVYLLALALPEELDEIDGNLSRLDFKRIRFPADREIPDCTAAELIARSETAAERQKAQEAERASRQEALAQRESAELLRRRAWLAYEAACVRAKGFAGQNAARFYLVGWTPEEEAETVKAECASLRGYSCVAASPREVKNTQPPVRIEDKGARAILSPLMKMYGLPAYGTADPRLFMVITYTVFFGMMFGDAGQGACIAVLGLLLYRKTKSWLWRILSLCGCSAVVFGLIYGSVFGLEDLLPWGGYHPLESEHIMPVLLAGAALGVCVIVVCMAFNIVNSLRLGDLKGALFSPNGVSGMVLYAAVIAAIVCAYTGAANLLVGWYVVLLIVLPVLLIWLGEPLAGLLEGKKNWQPESWGLYLVEGFFDIFEAAISYMSNTMSFLRVGAFAISHAGMMMVVSMLSQGAAATGSVVIMIFGNIFVAGLEAALSSIQIIRLEFYEIFGRFYVSGGREFAPVTVQYTN